MEILSIAVIGLSHAESLLPMLRDLGMKHKAYGVQERDYEAVAEALLWALKEMLGPVFTEDIREAWISAYTLLAAAM